MKYTLIILLLISIHSNSQKLFSKTNLISYGLCMIAGVSDGMNDAIVAGHGFHNSQFWNLYDNNSWENKYHRGWIGRNIFTMTSDGYHLTKFITYTSFAFAVGIQIGEKQNWKTILGKTALSFCSFKIGQQITYNMIK